MEVFLDFSPIDRLEDELTIILSDINLSLLLLQMKMSKFADFRNFLPLFLFLESRYSKNTRLV